MFNSCKFSIVFFEFGYSVAEPNAEVRIPLRMTFMTASISSSPIFGTLIGIKSLSLQQCCLSSSINLLFHFFDVDSASQRFRYLMGFEGAFVWVVFGLLLCSCGFLKLNAS